MNEKNSLLPSAFVMGALVALGICFASFLVSSAIKQFRHSGRFVTVKGLAERDVIADVAIWKIKFKASSNDLATANQKILDDLKSIQDFLHGHGITGEEIEISAPRVIDLLAREYGSEHVQANRYIIDETIRIKTNKVKNIEAASRQAIDLIKAGIVLDEASYGANPNYLYTKLNEVRPSMLAEATKSARVLAEQFASDAGSNVGPIRQANQGVFTIGSDVGEGDNLTQENVSAKKRIRVVTTIDYFLTD